MTSYVLLASLRGLDQSHASTVLPIVRWLSAQRNSHGGFSSTQVRTDHLDAHCCHTVTAIKHPVPDRVKPSVICNFWHPGTLTLSLERQSSRMSKITNDGLTRSGTGCFIAVTVWQQWPSGRQRVNRVNQWRSRQSVQGRGRGQGRKYKCDKRQM